MSGTLWGTGGESADEPIIRYMAAEDALLDNALLNADLRATRAHVGGLATAGLLADDEATTLREHLDALIEEERAGSFRVGPDDEDGHTAIERELTERAGALGKKVHTGRSRNDQVLVATRLWLKEALADVADALDAAARIAVDRAAQTEGTLLPGYTHLQRAVPSTAGFWFAGHAESLIEDAIALRGAIDVVDTSPLGTAAGYGVNLELARDQVAEELGFARVQLNGLAAQNSRGRFELHALGALLLPMATARRIAWDLSLFSMSELGFVTLPDAYCTGSSIMPNKHNPDAAELIRAAFGEVAGAHVELAQVIALPSAYQRDLQRTKPPLLRGVAAARATLSLLPALLEGITFDEERCVAALDAGMLATDRALELAREGTPFREAYLQVKRELDEMAADDLAGRARASVDARVSLGAPGNLALDRLRAQLE